MYTCAIDLPEQSTISTSLSSFTWIMHETSLVNRLSRIQYAKHQSYERSVFLSTRLIVGKAKV